MSAFPYTRDPFPTDADREYAKKLGMDFVPTGHPLAPSLGMAVPFAIHDLVQQGGPTDADRAALTQFADELAAHGDDLIFRGTKKGDSAKLFAKLVRAIAVMAFYPGGIRVFGTHYEAHVAEAEVKQ